MLNKKDDIRGSCKAQIDLNPNKLNSSSKQITVSSLIQPHIKIIPQTTLFLLGFTEGVSLGRTTPMRSEPNHIRH